MTITLVSVAVALLIGGIEALARGCPNIEQIDVNGCTSLGA